MSQRIHAAPNQHPGRVLVMQDGVAIAMGSLSNLLVISRALSTANIDIYLHPDDAYEFKAWQIAESERKRRLN
ncbi:hypothetical protein V1294_006034 [Bradyrhizobium sp. AZCC 1678]|uniref:hypothetical protein n=1 Tax=Bradyrhizobium sp. AZCC 1678 TaxID=3117030 RepID=UPI002FF054B5